jgi:hypothetical protein
MLVAVPAVRTVGDVPMRVQAAFEQTLATEVRKLDGVGAIGAGEIGDVVSLEAEGRMRGCTQDEACLLDVAQGLGMAELLSSEVVVEGKDYQVTLRRVGVRTGKPIVSDVRKVKKGDGDELLRAVGPMVEGLYPDRGLKPGATRGVDADVLKRLNPPALPVWVFATTATAAGISLIAGGTFAILANDAKNQYNALAAQSTTQAVSGAQLNSLQDQLDTQAQLANIFLITGGVLAAGAVVEIFFTDWKDYRSQIFIAPTSKGGAVAGVAGTF